jgi:hypothetical protein
MSFLFLLNDLARVYSKRRGVPELAAVFFVFASGVGWKWMFLPHCRNNVNANMAHCFCSDKETFWIHSVVHYLFPQRSGLFSIGICIALTLIFVHEVENDLADSKSLLLAGIMMGLLPCLSAHSFIGAGEYAIFICVLNFPWSFNYKAWLLPVTRWAIFGGTAILLALPQILWLMRMKRQDFFVFKPIWWETNSKYGFFTMWWESLGSFVILSVANVWLSMSSWQRLMYYPSIGVFVVSNFIRYQPGAMDNTKVYLCAWYPIACCAVAEYFIQLLSHAHRHVFVVVPLIGLVVISFVTGSIVCLAKALLLPFPMFSPAEMKLGLWVMENTRPDTYMLCEGWHSSPMLSRAGRLITLGSGGWVWSHGFDYGARERWNRYLYANRENVSLFDAVGISYAVSKTDKQFNLFPNPGLYSVWMNVLDIGDAQLYRLTHT